VAVLGPVETTGAGSVRCGGPGVAVALGGGDPAPERGADCREEGRYQTLGGVLAATAGTGLLAARRLGRRAAARRAAPSDPEPVVTPDPAADPGWRPALRSLVPFFGLLGGPHFWSGRRAQGLVIVRQLLLAFVMAIVLFAFVLSQLDLSPTNSTWPVGTAMVVVGVVALAGLAARPVVDRPLDCSTGPALARSWRTRLMVRLALAEAPALVGFAAAFLTGSPSPFYLGGVAALLAFARAAPTARHLADDQAAIDARGSSLTVVAALNGAEAS